MRSVGGPDHDGVGSDSLDSGVTFPPASDESSGLLAILVPESLHLGGVTKEDGAIQSGLV